MVPRIDIYAESSDRSARPKKRKAMYVLVYRSGDKEATAGEYMTLSGTWTNAIMNAVNRALARIKCVSEVHIHTTNTVVLDMIEYQIEDMAEKGFVKKNGDPVANRDEWEGFWNLSRDHLVVTEPGRHEFLSWMESQMNRMTMRSGGVS